jgi:outer membrane protein, multidrug efflux system
LIGASRANFFPKLALLALVGTQDINFRLFSPHNLFGTIGPSIDIPLFDAGLRQAELQISKAQFTEAAEGYRATVLWAMKEVQDEACGRIQSDDHGRDGGAQGCRPVLDPLPQRRLVLS